MPQQINLCSPILLTRRKYFTAQAMAVGLAVFVVLGAVLGGLWVWNLKQASRQYQATVDAQAQELAGLQNALAKAKQAQHPVDPALSALLDARNQQLAQRHALLEALKEGVVQPGNAYSDRLRFLATSTPMPVWVTGVLVSGSAFQVSGFTLEPAALNAWVAGMATHPLFQGLHLSDVQVQSTAQATAPGSTVAAAPVPVAVASAPAGAGRPPLWSFTLGSTRPMVPEAGAAPSAGGKP